jgi:hypothetical protein
MRDTVCHFLFTKDRHFFQQTAAEDTISAAIAFLYFGEFFLKINREKVA